MMMTWPANQGYAVIVLAAALGVFMCCWGEVGSFTPPAPAPGLRPRSCPPSYSLPLVASRARSRLAPSPTVLYADKNPLSFFGGWGGKKEPDVPKKGPAGKQDLKAQSKVVRSGFPKPTPPPVSAGVKARPGVVVKDEEETEKASETGVLSSLQKAVSGITDTLQKPIQLGPIISKLTFLGVGFIGGLGSGLVYFLEPYGSVSENVIKPVTLFENVLVELDRGYVDKVDHEKLFETAVGSMLQSLDPYTEFEDKQLAQDMREAVSGRYGGVGLVIAGSKVNKQAATSPAEVAAPTPGKEEEGAEAPGPISKDSKAKNQKGAAGGFRDGITVVSAFEGYAFDAGMRVGDKLVAVDGIPVADRTVDQVRDLLRGSPDTQVRVAFQRAGLDGMQEVSLTRRLIRVPDVKLAAFLGDRKEGIGYIQLTGFSQGAASEVQYALELLRQRAPEGLKGIILDLRGNPGGLLNSAVDVASLLVPADSEIVSARGRSFEPVSYTSSLKPARDNSIPLAILVNSATASAAEIVSGAVQDLDSGVVIGADRTFGKGLVQNVESLPYNTALKYTGRCIQSIKYSPPDSSKVLARSENGPDKSSFSSREPTYEASKVPENERKSFRTLHGRVVQDGGGIEADIKVSSPEASLLELTLLQQGAFFDYASEWAKTHVYKGEGLHPWSTETVVTPKTYDDFKRFVHTQMDKGDLKLDVLFSSYIDPLQQAFKETKLDEPERELSLLRKAIQAELEEEFTKNQAQISEQIEEAILARYVPESALRRKSLDNDPQVKKAVETLKNKREYYALLRPQHKVTTLADVILEQIERGELVEVKPGENTEAAL